MLWNLGFPLVGEPPAPREATFRSFPPQWANCYFWPWPDGLKSLVFHRFSLLEFFNLLDVPLDRTYHWLQAGLLSWLAHIETTGTGTHPLLWQSGNAGTLQCTTFQPLSAGHFIFLSWGSRQYSFMLSSFREQFKALREASGCPLHKLKVTEVNPLLLGK